MFRNDIVVAVVAHPNKTSRPRQRHLPACSSTSRRLMHSSRPASACQRVCLDQGESLSLPQCSRRNKATPCPSLYFLRPASIQAKGLRVSVPCCPLNHAPQHESGSSLGSPGLLCRLEREKQTWPIPWPIPWPLRLSIPLAVSSGTS